MRRWLIAAVVYLLARRRARPRVPGRPRIVSPGAPSPRAELAVVGLLVLAAALATAFILVYALDAQTQLLGLALGGALACISAAFVVSAKRVLPDEEREEEYSPPRHPEAEAEVDRILDESGEPVTRSGLIKLAAGGAGAALGAALLVPALSLGPALRGERLHRSPWHSGRRLVDHLGRALRVDELEEDTFVTAFPEGADPEEIAAPLIVVRVPEDELELPDGRQGWAPQGIVAYSKICTHAGCAVSIYRAPKFEPASPRRALVCPCHYSTFDPARGAEVLFGPAGRPLPQLPLREESGVLVAAGGFSDGVGPSWWGVSR